MLLTNQNSSKKNKKVGNRPPFYFSAPNPLLHKVKIFR